MGEPLARTVKALLHRDRVAAARGDAAPRLGVGGEQLQEHLRVPQRGIEATLLLVLNAHHDLVEYTLPEYEARAQWSLLIDTNIPDLGDPREFSAASVYGVTGRSLLLFELRA